MTCVTLYRLSMKFVQCVEQCCMGPSELFVHDALNFQKNLSSSQHREPDRQGSPRSEDRWRLSEPLLSVDL